MPCCDMYGWIKVAGCALFSIILLCSVYAIMDIQNKQYRTVTPPAQTVFEHEEHKILPPMNTSIPRVFWAVGS